MNISTFKPRTKGSCTHCHGKGEYFLKQKDSINNSEYTLYECDVCEGTGIDGNSHERQANGY